MINFFRYQQTDLYRLKKSINQKWKSNRNLDRDIFVETYGLLKLEKMISMLYKIQNRKDINIVPIINVMKQILDILTEDSDTVDKKRALDFLDNLETELNELISRKKPITMHNITSMIHDWEELS